MNEFVILTDSCADLPEAISAEYGIRVIPLEVHYEDGSSQFNNEVDYKAFFARLRSKEKVTTAAINMDRFIGFFEETLAEGKDVLYLGFSSALSATYKAATLAAEEVAQKYPSQKILVVDTKCASLGQGLFAVLVAEKKKSGATLEETCAYAEEIVPNLCHWFTVDDLFFLKRGGRVSAAKAVIGTMLSVKPVLHVDDEGRLMNVSTVRGRKASIAELFKHMQADAIEPDGQLIYICHGDCYEDAVLLSDMIKETYPACRVMIDYVGPVIGAHSGPGTLALFYLGTKR